LYFFQEVINGSINVVLFEYDDRFAIKYGDRFVHYDYNSPLTVPVEMCHAFDLVVSDPPFLSEECFVKVAQTMRLLAKDSDSKSILCTGTIMEELVSLCFKL
jgi:EEF1A lysine methyltransferase 1